MNKWEVIEIIDSALHGTDWDICENCLRVITRKELIIKSSGYHSGDEYIEIDYDNIEMNGFDQDAIKLCCDCDQKLELLLLRTLNIEKAQIQW